MLGLRLQNLILPRSDQAHDKTPMDKICGTITSRAFRGGVTAIGIAVAGHAPPPLPPRRGDGSTQCHRDS